MVTDTLFFDTETFSETPIKDGTYAYASDAEVMIATYAFNDGPVGVWDATDGSPMPEALQSWLTNPDVIVVAHNAMFDRNVLRLGKNVKIEVPIRRWRCSMVRAMAHALPGSLDKLCEILGVAEDKAKIKDGKKLIQLFCKPMPKNHKLRRATRETHPEEWERFIEYAVADIHAMREVWNKLPEWNYRGIELEHYHRDQEINDRGFQVDLDLAQAALRAVDKEQANLKDQTFALTDGEVSSATKRDAMLDHILAYYGIALPDLKGATIERRLDDPDIPEPLKELLRVRLMATTTSTSKYKALIKATNKDGRLRGTIQFDGAKRTRRAAGRTFQPQNLPSRGLLPEDQIEAGIELLKQDQADLIFDNVMLLTSSAIRGCIVAPPGRKLVVADLANIEGRDQAWLAGESWKLQAFRDYDTFLLDANGNRIPEKDDFKRKGHDLYKLAYAKSFGIMPEEVDKKQRAIGKVQELALGYEGGVGAFMTFAAAYGIDLEELSDQAIGAIPDDIFRESEDFYDWLTQKKNGNTFGLSKQAFIVCDSFKRSWRYAHPNISALWKELGDTVRKAINNPGTTFPCRRFKIRRDGNWLRIGLPSGRALCYPSPRLDDNGAISYLGENQYTRKWERIHTHGGKLFENCIAEGTRVLTSDGWIPIQCVRSTHRIWDGEEWVSHNGLKHSGKQFVIQAHGVTMTPDHLILTEGGWVRACESEGYNRFKGRIPNSYPILWEQREEIDLGSGVHLRESHPNRRERTEEAKRQGDRSVVRVYEAGYDIKKEYSPWDVAPPGIRSMAVYVGSMFALLASGLEKLRGTGDSGLRKMERIFRELLGRYGSDVSGRIHSGSIGQRARVPCSQLRMEDPETPRKQQADECCVGYPQRTDDSIRSSAILRDRTKHLGISGIEGGTDCGRPDSAEVYDILDCGPRNRFMVLDANGEPLIVHNCCQSLARDVLYDATPAIEDAGYEIVLTVHDEVICEAPDTDEFNPEHLSKLLATNPPWALDMPLSAAGFESYRYKKG